MPFLGTTPTQGFVSAVTKQSFTPNGSTTAFTLSHSVANENDLEVFVGNVRQEPGSGKAYTAAGTTLTMSEAVASGVNFYVIFKNKAQVTTTPPVNSISTDKIANDAVTGAKIENNPTIAGNLTVSGDLAVDTNTLHVDSSNNKVGIGTTSPAETLEVVHATAPAIQLNRTNDGGFKSIIRQQGNDTEFRGSSGSTKIYTGAADGDSSTARLLIDANGHVTMPHQSAFSANLGVSSQSNIAVGSDITVEFDNEIFDQNADFNNTNHTFTAPVTGRYQFNITYYLETIDTATGYYYIYFDTSNRNYFNIFSPAFTADTSYLTLTLSVLADMDASDVAVAKIRQSHGSVQTDINANSYFSGYLVA